MPYPIARKTELVTISTDQVKEIDQLMENNYGIRHIQTMENTGSVVANLSRELFLEGNARFKNIMFLIGPGKNGGGALVAARRLHNYGAKVQIALSSPPEFFKDLPLYQLNILEKMGIEAKEAKELKVPPINFDLVIDGVAGNSMKGNPKAGAAKLIEWANSQTAPILSVDVPSGVDLGIGEVYEPVIQASATVTLGLPKSTLFDPVVSKHLGRLFLADISIPPQLYAHSPLDLNVGNVFAESDIVEIKIQ